MLMFVLLVVDSFLICVRWALFDRVFRVCIACYISAGEGVFSV